MAKSNKWIRRIRRELTANPKKAAFLGLLLAVAVWFWMPLIEKMSGEKPNEVAATTGTNTPAVEAPTNTAAAGSDIENSKSVRWKQVVEWIRNDPMTQSQVPQPGARDPFAPSESHRLARENAARKAQAAIPSELTPEESGLSLRSTVVGPRTKTALINERAYHEGQTVIAPKENDHFKLVKIDATSVVLERNGKQYELKLPTAEVAGTDE